MRLTWAEILRQEPSAEVINTLNLDPRPLCRAGLFLMVQWLKCVGRLYGRMRVKGVEHLPPQGPYIVSPNHLSNADAPLLAAAMPWSVTRQAFFLGITDFFGGPVTSRIAKKIQVIPVNMETKLYSALQLSSYVLRKGKVLCVFPEGSRSRDGKIKEFKKGVGILAKELDIPVVPVAIHGTYEMLRAGKLFPRPGKVTVTFGKPVHPGGRDYEGIARKLYEEVVALLEEGKARGGADGE